MGVMDDLKRMAEGESYEAVMLGWEEGDRVAIEPGTWAQLRRSTPPGMQTPPRRMDGTIEPTFRLGTVVSVFEVDREGEPLHVVVVKHDGMTNTYNWHEGCLEPAARWLKRQPTMNPGCCELCGGSGLKGCQAGVICPCQQGAKYDQEDEDYAARRRRTRGCR